MGSNRYLTYIWTVVNMIPLPHEPSHNGSIRRGENVYQPLLRGWGEREEREFLALQKLDQVTWSERHSYTHYYIPTCTILL